MLMSPLISFIIVSSARSLARQPLDSLCCVQSCPVSSFRCTEQYVSKREPKQGLTVLFTACFYSRAMS